MTFIIGSKTITEPNRIQKTTIENADFQQVGSGVDVVQFYGRSIPGIQISGILADADVDDVWAEKEREEPILLDGGVLLSDVWSGGQVYGKIYTFQPVMGHGEDYHDYTLNFAVLGSAAAFKRCSYCTPVLVYNDFVNEGKIRVDLPIGAGSASESTTYTRTVNGGSIIVSELLNNQPYVKYSVTEANLALGNVAFTKKLKDLYLGNSSVEVRSRLEGALPNLGRFTGYYYSTGAALTELATISLQVKSSGGTLENFDDKGPVVEPFSNHKQFGSIWFSYPSSATEYYRINGRIHMWRGRPILKFIGRNICEASFTEIRLKTFTDSTSFRYYTVNGAIMDAQADVYGEQLDGADADANQYAVLSTESDLTSDTCVQLGLFTQRQGNRDWRATDAGDYWSDLSVTLDNLSASENMCFPPIWVFMQKKGNTQTAPVELVNEAMREPWVYQTVREGVT